CPSGTFVPVQLFAPLVGGCPNPEARLVAVSCGPCVRLVSIEKGPDSITVRAIMRPFLCGPAGCVQDSLSVPVDSSVVGQFGGRGRVMAEVVHEDSGVCVPERAENAPIPVPDCPPPGPLPPLDSIEIGTQVVCVRAPCPPLACPYIDIPVSVRGHFDD